MKVSFASGFRRRLSRPRRLLPQFTLRGVLALVTGYGVLLGFLRWMQASPAQWVLLLSFFSAVWVGRRFLFSGRRPRIASILIGVPFGIAVWRLAWKEAESAAVGLGTRVPTDEVVRDLFAAILLSAVLALAAHVLFTWALNAIELVGILCARLKRNQHSSHFAAERCIGAGGGIKPERREGGECDFPSVGKASSLQYRPIVSAAVVVVVVGCAVVLRGPVQILFYHYAGERCGRRALNWDRRDPCPLDIWLLWLSTDENTLDGSVYSQLNEAYRDKLVELGYLEHRVFVFDHIMTGPDDERQREVFRLALERSPHNIYTEGSWSDKPEPYRLYVWDRPEQIAGWEAFVREMDRPSRLDDVSGGLGIRQRDGAAR